MSLAIRLTLSFAALILALGLAAFVGLRALTDDLTAALGETAASVSRSVVTVLRGDFRMALDGKPLEPGSRTVDTVDLRGPEGSPQREIRMVVNGRELNPQEIADRLRASPPDPTVELRSGSDGGPPMLWVRGLGSEQPIALPRSGMDAALQRFQRQLGWGLLLLLAVGIGIAAWLARRLSRPLASLTEAAEAVGTGTLGVQVPEQGPPELRRSLAAFNRMSADLQRLDREAAALRADRELAELGEVGRGLAHSLRNPLHALGLSLEALAAGTSDPATAESLHRAGREQLARIDQALRGFLALSAGAGAQTEPVALRAIVDDVLLEASQRAQGQVRFTCAGADLSVLGVPAELRILVHALVVNALEASPPGGQVCVSLQAIEGDAGGARVVVEDDGDGIPEAIRARLFAPHVSSKPSGAGMGLYLAQRLARLRYGGGITLIARSPRGTRAELSLHDREAPAHG